MSHNAILKQIKNLDTKKALRQNDIPTKFLKQNSYFFSNFFHKNVNQCIKNSKFPPDLKLADVTLSDETSSFNELLEENNFVLIHHKNLQTLAMEMYKIFSMSPAILDDIFSPRATPYNLRNPVNFKMRKVH